MLEITTKDKEFVLSNLEFIKTRDWYEENKNILSCIERIDDGKKVNNALVSINKQLIVLYKHDIKYREDLIKAEKDLELREKFHRDTMITILKKFDKNLLIVDSINQILGES